MSRIRKELQSWNETLRPESMPCDPSEFSFWVAANLLLDDAFRLHLLTIDSAIQRLRCELSIMRRVGIVDVLTITPSNDLCFHCIWIMHQNTLSLYKHYISQQINWNCILTLNFQHSHAVMMTFHSLGIHLDGIIHNNNSYCAWWFGLCVIMLN